MGANALVSSRVEYCNSLFRSLSSFNMRKLQCMQNTLGRIVTKKDTHRLLTKNSIGVFSKLPLLFTSFFTVVTQAISALICLFIVEDMEQDTTIQIIGSWRFLVLQIQNKNHFGHSFTFDAPTLWNDLPDVLLPQM